MAKDPRQALRKVGATERPTPARSAVGDEITRHLRSLQAQRVDALDVDAVVTALVPAVAQLARRGMLVSLAVTSDQRSVRLSALIAKEWIPWYAADEEEAEALVVALSDALPD